MESKVAVVTEKSEPLGVKVELVERDNAPMGVQLVNPYSVNKSEDPMDLVALAQQVQKADEFTRATCGSKLTVIADQIKYLQQQARKVLEDAKRDHELHHAACNLVKKPGNLYYLYRRPSGQAYFSLLSPQEWGASCPHEFLDAYRLEYDQSWTPIKQLDKRSEEMVLVDKIINQQLAITDSTNILGLPEVQRQQSAHVQEINH